MEMSPQDRREEEPVKRAIVSEPHRVTVVEVKAPPILDHHARVAIKACGICGSDLHTFEGHHPFVDYPVYPGHELAGMVAEVGMGVPKTWVGRLVTVEPSLACGECENCRAGRYNICDRLKVMGFQSPGGMGEEFVVPVDRLVQLPAAMTAEQGALVEPLAVAVHASRLPASLIGRDVLVLGAGTIGLLMGQVVRAYGARQVVLTDPIPARRSLAGRLGLTAVDVPQDGSEVIVEQFHGRRPDIAFECVGAEAALRQGIELVRKGGEIIIVGVFGREALVPAGLIQDHELRIQGSLMYVRFDFEEAIRLITEGRVDVDPLISHRVPLAAVDRAFMLAGGRDGVKVIVIP
jgi:L-iditol 2-dehydrogenase